MVVFEEEKWSSRKIRGPKNGPKNGPQFRYKNLSKTKVFLIKMDPKLIPF
jgi:hypothetical protein